MLMRKDESEIKVVISYGDKDLLECVTNMILSTCQAFSSTDIINNKVEKECVDSG